MSRAVSSLPPVLPAIALAAYGSAAPAGPAASAAPAFSVTTVDGRGPSWCFDLGAQRGKPVVAYFYYASWCAPCVGGASALARLHAARPVVAALALDVNPSDTPAMVAQFRRLVPDATYPFALDPGGRVATSYGVKALEESIVIGPAGALAFHNTVSPTLDLLERQVREVARS